MIAKRHLNCGVLALEHQLGGIQRDGIQLTSALVWYQETLVDFDHVEGMYGLGARSGDLLGVQGW